LKMKNTGDKSKQKLKTFNFKKSGGASGNEYHLG
jgi:hypothetical protein